MKFRPGGKKLKCRVNLRTFGIKPFLSKDIIQHPSTSHQPPLESSGLWIVRVCFPDIAFSGSLIKYKGSSKKTAFGLSGDVCRSPTSLSWVGDAANLDVPNQTRCPSEIQNDPKACSAAKIVHLVDSILISLCFLKSISVTLRVWPLLRGQNLKCTYAQEQQEYQ